MKIKTPVTEVCTPKAEAFELHTVAGRLVDPSLNLDQISALIMMDDEAYKYEETPDGGAA
jgi:hypothetical protein